MYGDPLPNCQIEIHHYLGNGDLGSNCQILIPANISAIYCITVSILNAHTEYDYSFEEDENAVVTHPGGNAGVAQLYFIPIYDDGIAEDVEGLVLFLELFESELDPRDVGFINLPRSAYLIIINPSGTANIITCITQNTCS